MILSDNDIREYIKKGIIKVSPLHEDQIGPASIDLTLSGEWAKFKNNYKNKTVDLSQVSFKEATETFFAESVSLNSGEIILAKTLEKITLPPNIMGKLEGRSRYARMGLSVHITSAVVQPGSSNHQVLEIMNSAPFAVILKKGMRISQIFFYELKSETSKPYAKYGEIAKNQ